MKHILLGLLVVLSFNTYAKNNKAMTGTLKATVDEVFCGEMDPMVWGDICLILVSKGNKKYGIVADHEGFFEDYDLEGEASQLNGHPITVDFTEVERIESKSKRRILRRYAKGYFFVTASSAKAMSFPYAERATSYNDKFY
ncbi:MAG: hypothetical protein HOM21_06580, partial [Halobacteriovoraceae bacterium]|nr:hypothetical protein [Halobacteriovoraceae bacterium]